MGGRFRRLVNNENILGWLLVFPALATVCTFLFYPMAQAFRYSFFNWNLLGNKTFIGLDNYFYLLLEDMVFKQTLINTFYFTFFNVVGSVIIALGAALIAQHALRGIGFFRTVFFVPVVIPMAIAGIVWKLMFEPQFGAMNAMMSFLGMPEQKWLFDSALAMPAVILVSIWKDFGLYSIIFVTGLQQIPNELYEAMEMDGAGRWQRFLHLTLPLLRPTTFFVTTMLMINSFKVFDQVWVMTQGGPGTSTITLVTYIYERVLESVGVATAASVILFILVLLLMFIQYKLIGRDNTA